MGNTRGQIVQVVKISDDRIFQKTVNGLDGDSRPINRNGKAAQGTVHILRRKRKRGEPRSRPSVSGGFLRHLGAYEFSVAQALPFKAGRIQYYLNEWETISSDCNILDIVKGCQMEFKSNTPNQMKHPKETKFSNVETGFIDPEIKRLLEKGVIVPICHETGEFVSTIFVRPKPDGSHRLVLNLKRFNEHVAYHHFKMESLKSTLQMMKPGCYTASVDPKDAYYSVHVDTKHQKFLNFYWRSKLYQYTCLPNGLACAPRVSTKLLKPFYFTLRTQGHLSVGYIYDSYLQGNTIQNCQNNIQKTVNLFTSLGFIVHPEKSVLVPTRKLEFLGFILDSERMIASLTPERVGDIKEAAKILPLKPNPFIRELAEVIGKFVATFHGCLYGPLWAFKLECR